MNAPPVDPPSSPAPAGEARIVLTTAPAGEAEGLARALVEERLAACVNVVPGVRSFYRWKGTLQDDPETLLIVKTGTGRLPALAARLEDLHPYDVPELLVLTPESGGAVYLAWLAAAIDPEAAETPEDGAP